MPTLNDVFLIDGVYDRCYVIYFIHMLWQMLLPRMYWLGCHVIDVIFTLIIVADVNHLIF